MALQELSLICRCALFRTKQSLLHRVTRVKARFPTGRIKMLNIRFSIMTLAGSTSSRVNLIPVRLDIILQAIHPTSFWNTRWCQTPRKSKKVLLRSCRNRNIFLLMTSLLAIPQRTLYRTRQYIRLSSARMKTLLMTRKQHIFLLVSIMWTT